MKENREYKNDVFCMLMEDPMNALALYNALNGSDLSDPSLVEMCTLDKGVSVTVHNDAAFIVDASLSVYEHQSTVCPNMPVRSLVYFSNMLESMIKGKNEDILEKCPFLKDYMTFIDYVRRFHKENGYEQLYDAIERAIDRCIEENVLRDFLIEHRSEVVKVTRLDYTFEQQILLEREDAREEGREEGRQEGREEGRQEGREEGHEEGFEEGIEAGNEQGQDQLSSMLSWLIASGRNDDVTRAVNDKSVRTELYKEYEKVNPMKK